VARQSVTNLFFIFEKLFLMPFKEKNFCQQD
jgi:hypothetical protein